MALTLPSTQVLADRYLAFFENKLNQDSPLNDKAFLRVLSVVLAMNHTELYKYAGERVLQNLALTATGEDLDNIGREYNIIRTPATAAVIEAEISLLNGESLPAGTTYIGDANGMRYFQNTGVIGDVTNLATIEVTAEEPGVAGNLEAGAKLAITSPVAAAGSEAEVQTLATTGADEEDDENYRIRVLDEIRRVGGGSNAADYRRWGQEVAGVRRVYPYSGKPWLDPGTDYPPDRTVYVEAEESVDPEGVPPAGMLDDVRDSITTDPVTGLTRQCLGLTDETLYVEPIRPKELWLQIHKVNVVDDDETAAINAIDDAMENYVKKVRNFIAGLDVDGERRDFITRVSLSDVVQDALTPFNGTAEEVFFGFAEFDYTVSDLYRLDPGETMILGGIEYV